MQTGEAALPGGALGAGWQAEERGKSFGFGLKWKSHRCFPGTSPARGGSRLRHPRPEAGSASPPQAAAPAASPGASCPPCTPVPLSSPKTGGFLCKTEAPAAGAGRRRRLGGAGRAGTGGSYSHITSAGFCRCLDVTVSPWLMHIPAGRMKSPGMGGWKRRRGRRKAEGWREGDGGGMGRGWGQSWGTGYHSWRRDGGTGWELPPSGSAQLLQDISTSGLMPARAAASRPGRAPLALLGLFGHGAARRDGGAASLHPCPALGTEPGSPRPRRAPRARTFVPDQVVTQDDEEAEQEEDDNGHHPTDHRVVRAGGRGHRAGVCPDGKGRENREEETLWTLPRGRGCCSTHGHNPWRA